MLSNFRKISVLFAVCAWFLLATSGGTFVPVHSAYAVNNINTSDFVSSFQFTDFLETTNLNINKLYQGQSHPQVNVNEGILELTHDADNYTYQSGQAGSVYYNQSIDVVSPFYTVFKFEIIREACPSVADGLALNFATDPFFVGGAGISLGAYDATSLPGVAIEFDTFPNAPNENSQHIGINLNRNKNSLAYLNVVNDFHYVAGTDRG